MEDDDEGAAAFEEEDEYPVPSGARDDDAE